MANFKPGGYYMFRSWTKDSLNTNVAIFADSKTGNPDQIIIGFEIFNDAEGAILATRKLLPGITMHSNTPYGIFQPSGLIECTWLYSKYNYKRFYFDQIDYLQDCVDCIILQLGIRFEHIIGWRQIVLNQ